LLASSFASARCKNFARWNELTPRDRDRVCFVYNEISIVIDALDTATRSPREFANKR
jgi:hypothetical protein